MLAGPGEGPGHRLSTAPSNSKGSALGHTLIIPPLGMKLLAKETHEPIFAPMQVVDSLCASVSLII